MTSVAAIARAIYDSQSRKTSERSTPYAKAAVALGRPLGAAERLRFKEAWDALLGKPPVGTGKRFASLSKKLAKRGAHDPDALAAWIGRKTYGAKKFQKMAAVGKTRAKKGK